MRHATNDAVTGMSRRQLLRGVGGGGITAVAGCLGGGEGPPFGVRFEVAAVNDDRVRMVQLIAQSLEESGYFETEIEEYEWNTYVGRVMDSGYADRGHIPCIRLSGTFNPGSFCGALHHSANHGQCCNLNGISDAGLDEAIDGARFGVDVVEDPAIRRERYDEIWRTLADERYSSLTHFELSIAVTNTDVYGYTPSPFQESLLSYGLYAPQDEQVTWIDRGGGDPESATLSDLRTGGTLRGALDTNIISFDPPYTNDTTATLAQSVIFEHLTAADSDGTVYPWLARDYELREVQDVDRTDYEEYMIAVATDGQGALETTAQVIVHHPEDAPLTDETVRVLTPEGAAAAVADGVFGMQFRYDLHEGVEFHNGEELTAENVVQTVQRYENSDLAPQTFDSLLHAEAVDTYTVDLYAQVPDAEAERELPALAIHATDQTGLEGGELDPRRGVTPIGTGPYEFEAFEDEQYYEVRKNENYWLEHVGIDRKQWFDGPSSFPDGPVIDAIELEIVPDPPTRSAALQNGEIDITYELSAGTLDEFDRSDGFIVSAVDAGGYVFIQYPVAVEPWDDARLRRAVNHLIPRERIVEDVLNGWATPAWTAVPEIARQSGTADYDALESEIRLRNEYDPERAEELIEAVLADRE